MAHHNELGKYGEQLAGVYLTEKNFLIMQTNWKYSWYEIDIIASKNNMIHFIEVKTRSNHRFGYPEEGVDKKKMKRLMKAAEQYLHLHPVWKHVQYDIISISVRKNGLPEFFFIEDVYF